MWMVVEGHNQTTVKFPGADKSIELGKELREGNDFLISEYGDVQLIEQYEIRKFDEVYESGCVIYGVDVYEEVQLPINVRSMWPVIIMSETADGKSIVRNHSFTKEYCSALADAVSLGLETSTYDRKYIANLIRKYGGED